MAQAAGAGLGNSNGALVTASPDYFDTNNHYARGVRDERERVRKGVETIAIEVQVLPELPGLWQSRSAGDFRCDVLALIDGDDKEE